MTKNPEEGNSVVELYVQVGTDDLAQRSMLDMVDQVSFPRLLQVCRTCMLSYQLSKLVWVMTYTLWCCLSCLEAFGCPSCYLM